MNATIRKAAEVRIAPPLADALNGWRAAQAAPVDPYVKLLDAEVEKSINEGRGGNPSYDLGFTQGLKKARDLYTNPPRSDK
jgi:hypothetical protein